MGIEDLQKLSPFIASAGQGGLTSPWPLAFVPNSQRARQGQRESKLRLLANRSRQEFGSEELLQVKTELEAGQPEEQGTSSGWWT